MDNEKWESSESTFTVLDTSTDVPWPVFNIIKNSEGSIDFIEGCDRYYEANMSKEEAKRLLLAAISWLDKS